MFRFAIRTFFQNKLRLAIAIFGVLFSLTLMMIQIGIFIGFTKRTSIIVEFSDAQLWITPPGSNDFTTSEGLSEKILYQVKSTPGIEDSYPVIVGWSYIKKAGGETHAVQFIGAEPYSNVATPWKFESGSVADMRYYRNAIIDKTSRLYLGKMFKRGDITEVGGRFVNIVGVSLEAETFATYPYLFGSTEAARRVAPIPHNQVSFIAAKIKPGSDINLVKEVLQRKLNNVSVFTKEEFMNRIQKKWRTETGMGLAIYLNTLLAFVVGISIVGQTIMTMTMEKQKDYAILKALGASNSEVSYIVLLQATILTLIGFAISSGVISLVYDFYRGKGVPILITPTLWCVIFFITLIMGWLASSLAIYKVIKVDPMTVFKE